MKLIKLRLEYFRQHRSTEIEFQTGLTGITGANGAGKSTLLEALIFALFGARGIRGKVEDLTTRGFKARQTLVEVRFEHNLQVYSICRTIDDANLYSGGETAPLATGSRSVSESVAQILGMNHDEFINTYFTEQKGLEFLSGLRGATERSRFIVKMLGYDKLERAQELLRKDRAELKTKYQSLQSGQLDPEIISKQVALEKEKIKELAIQLNAAEQALRSAEQVAEQGRNEQKDLELIKAKYVALSNSITNSRSQLKIYTDQQLNAEKQLVIRQDKLIELERQQAKLYDLALEKEELQAKMQNNNQLLEDYTYTWQQARLTNQAESNLLKKQAEQMRTRITSIKQLEKEGQCPTCGQILGATFTEVVTGLCCEEQAIRTQIIELDGKVAKLAEKPEQLLELEEQRQKLTAELKKHEQLSHLDQELILLKKDLVDRASENQILIQKVKELELNIVEQEAKLQALNFDQTSYQNKQLTQQAAEGFVNVARLQRQKVESELEKQKALLERSQQSEKRQALLVSEIKSVKSEIFILDQGDHALTAVRNGLNASLRPRLAELASEFILDLTDGRYSAIEIADDFTPTVIEDGLAKPVISGGEQDILNLCLRLALSHMLAEKSGSEISLLVLDEVFGSLDDQRRINVLSLLEKLHGRFEQMLIITHLDDIKDGVQQLISVSYDDATAQVSTVQALA